MSLISALSLPVSACWPLTLLLTLQKGRSAMPWSSMRICLILRGSSERMSCCSSCPMFTLAEAETKSIKSQEIEAYTTERFDGRQMCKKLSVLYLECHRKKAAAWRWGWLWSISSSAAPPELSSHPPSTAPWRAYERKLQRAEAAPPGSHKESCKDNNSLIYKMIYKGNRFLFFNEELIQNVKKIRHSCMFYFFRLNTGFLSL